MWGGGMATTADPALKAQLEEIWTEPRGWYGWLSTADHKKIGKYYLVTAMVFLLLGGIEALILRIQLSGPNAGVVSPEAYNQIMTMHGTTMIFWRSEEHTSELQSR